MKRLCLLWLTGILLAAAGCGSGEKSDAFVRDAILHHLSNRTDLSLDKMDVTLDQVDYQGDRATAEVTISARDDSQARMQMVYNLKRAGGGWEVEPPSSSPHGGMTAPQEGSGSQMPPGHPPSGGAAEGETPELPSGHPPVTGGPASEQPAPSNPELPEGHPPIGTR